MKELINNTIKGAISGYLFSLFNLSLNNDKEQNLTSSSKLFLGITKGMIIGYSSSANNCQESSPYHYLVNISLISGLLTILQKAYEIHHKFQYSTNSQSQIAETYVTFVEHFLFATSLTLADYYLISPITDHVSSYFE